MLYILHGDDTISSRKRLTDIASGFSSPVFIQGDKANFSEIITAISSHDMFVEKKCVVIEHIGKLGKSDLSKVLPFFERSTKDNDITLVLWQNSELTKLQIGKFKQAVVESFMLPKLFFNFLDNFTPRNFKSEIAILGQMTNVDIMQIFYALIKRMRLLLMIKSGRNFEDLSKMSPWQKDKLKIQSSKFKTEELEDVYRKLFELEVKLKSGGLMLPLKKHLDIMIAQALH